MGDRANVYIKEGNGRGVFLYTHWAGYRLPYDLQVALRREVRWDDPAYLARIIFDQMTDGDHGAETGHGISAGINDNDGYPILIVDCNAQRVALGSAMVPPEPTGNAWPFAEYCKLPLGPEDTEWPS